MNAILMPAGIYYNLSHDTSVTSFVADDIYPIVAPNEVDYPFITFNITSFTPQRSKDGVYEDTAIVDIFVSDMDYFNMLKVDNAVYDAIEGSSYAGYYTNAQLVNMEHLYDDEAQGFISHLQFEVTG